MKSIFYSNSLWSSSLRLCLLLSFSLGGCCQLQAQSDCNSPGSLSGYVTTLRGAGLNQVVVTLTSRSSSIVRTATTDALGFYRVEDLPYGQTYDISLIKDDDSPYEGLDDRDATQLSRLVLQMDSLTYWQAYSADLNGNSTISSFDLVDLVRLIRRESDGLPGIVGNWRFIPDNATVGRAASDFSLFHLANPVLENLRSDASMNFTGVKAGDLDFNATGN